MDIIIKMNMNIDIVLKTFRHNNRYVNTKNRAGLTYKMKLNKFADRTVNIKFED